MLKGATWRALAALWIVADAGDAPECVQRIAKRVHRLRSEGAPRKRLAAQRTPASRASTAGRKAATTQRRKAKADRVLRADLASRRVVLNRLFGQLRRARAGLFADAAQWLRTIDARVMFVRYGAGNYCALLADAFDRIEAGTKASVAFELGGRPMSEGFSLIDDVAAIVEWSRRKNESEQGDGYVSRVAKQLLEQVEQIEKPKASVPDVLRRRALLEPLSMDDLEQWVAAAVLKLGLPRDAYPRLVIPKRKQIRRSAWLSPQRKRNVAPFTKVLAPKRKAVVENRTASRDDALPPWLRLGWTSKGGW